MHLHTRSVNTAFRELVSLFVNDGHYKDTKYKFSGKEVNVAAQIPIIKKSSRNGNVLMIDEPVTITYSHPWERVLFNAARDANPFLHLYEALWMLAGRNDVAPLAYYAKQMKEYSDDGETLNGAYGYRWRNKATLDMKPSQEWDADEGDLEPDLKVVDQLDTLVAHLKADPNSRRAVLQMWNVEDDLLKIGVRTVCDRCGSYADPCCHEAGRKIEPASKDLCCNLSVMFSIREIKCPECSFGEVRKESGDMNCGKCDARGFTRYLDMTVTNRSNDLIWGTLGANYVHFTFLQEYMATRLGVEVGKYHHFSNNLHSYDWNWEPEKWLSDTTVDMYQIPHTPLETLPLVKDPSAFDQQVKSIVEVYKDNLHPSKGSTVYFSEQFLMDVAQPAFQAFGCHKGGLPQRALEWAGQIKSDDWRIACTNWLNRRVKS